MVKEYFNENLAPGNWGYLFIILSFTLALLSLLSYIFIARLGDNHPSKKLWLIIARSSYIGHSLAVVSIFITLYYLIQTHQFQYNYVWSHSSTNLPSEYMISCFWEGQEGSFLLWTFWQSVLGIILICTAKKWESGVLIIIALAQVMLSSMLLGIETISLFGQSIHLGSLRIGSNPFALLRHAMPNIPLFQNANYIDLIKSGQLDGRGLNVLLQNYWMVIHPPVLFLGFASTIVPFAFAMAGIFRRDLTGWVKPALFWTALGSGLLGLGILMGGAWAYEALSFGGFWAWDPVENASLVPWLIMVSALHCMMIFNARKSALSLAFILCALTYILILYSTFLTRSGVLADSSVHSFTDLGLSGQLLLFLLLFVFLFLYLIIRNWKKIPKSQKEEKMYSREFWMFTGALLLCMSALHIITITSIPVFNKIAGLINDVIGNDLLKTNRSKPDNVIDVYHQLQIPFAIVIAILIGFGQYLRYITTTQSKFWKSLIIPTALSIVFSAVLWWLSGLRDWLFIILLFTSMFALFGNIGIVIGQLKTKFRLINGGAVAHIGFALILVGALISNAEKKAISINTENYNALPDANSKERRENKVLFKNTPVKMSDYTVTYKGDSTSGAHIYYLVEYKKFNENYTSVLEQFTLTPYAIFDKAQDKFTSASPSTKHYLSADIFTHISSSSRSDAPEYQVNYTKQEEIELTQNQKAIYDSIGLELLEVYKESTNEGKDTVYRLTAKVKVTDGPDVYYAEPKIIINGSLINSEEAEVKELGIKFRYMTVVNMGASHKFMVLKGNRPQREFITMKAIIFPMINLLWLGSILMVIGFMIAAYNRIKFKKSRITNA
ncbi:MAG: cytochrome c biogenesis protein CcsA [Bacteroidota bacterium]|nr:cytochrome c biogenesis protein CcsA [Bacteroidota bacterium]